MSKRIFQCTKCDKTYDRAKMTGCTNTTCNSCTVNKYRHERKLKSIKYLGGKCQRCGYNKCARALTFHHLDPSKKEFGISGSHTRAWNTIKTELDKCILVCQNCHAEIHDELDNAPIV